MKSVHFYFDPISPYVYLAWIQIENALRDTDAVLKPIPILFAGLLNAHGQKGPAEIPVKLLYTMHDLLRWAQKLDLKVIGPPSHPFNPLLALRVCTACENDADRVRLGRALSQACWERGMDLANPEVIQIVLNELQLDSEKLLEMAMSSEIKSVLKETTQAAVDRGVFGVPTFVVDDELFFGNDRLPFLRDYLTGSLKSSREAAEVMFKRPASASRI